MCLSNFKAMRQFKVPISWLRDFTISYEKTSFRILRRGPGHGLLRVCSVPNHYTNQFWHIANCFRGTSFSEIRIKIQWYSLNEVLRIWKCRLQNGGHFVSVNVLMYNAAISYTPSSGCYPYMSVSYTISRFTGFNPVRNFGSQPGYPARRGWGTWKERGPRWSWLGSGVVDASRWAGSM